MADTRLSTIRLINCCLMNYNMHLTSATFHPMPRKLVSCSDVLTHLHYLSSAMFHSELHWCRSAKQPPGLGGEKRKTKERKKHQQQNIMAISQLDGGQNNDDFI